MSKDFCKTSPSEYLAHQTVQGMRSGSGVEKFQCLGGKQRRSTKNRREIVRLRGARVRRK